MAAAQVAPACLSSMPEAAPQLEVSACLVDVPRALSVTYHGQDLCPDGPQVLGVDCRPVGLSWDADDTTPVAEGALHEHGSVFLRIRGETIESSETGHYSPSEARIARKCSDLTFHQRDQTLIIFDWDDTLCPSSACMESHGLLGLSEEAVPEAAAMELHLYALHARELLRQACQLAAHVAIVTNGGQGWVEQSCAVWLPALQSELASVEVVSARAKWEPCGVSSPTGWKAREFQSVIDRFYSRYENQSWKNIIAVGDAPYEHAALQRVVEGASFPNCRSKSVRFLNKPSIEALGMQIGTLSANFEEIVAFDGCLDLQIPEEPVFLE